MEEIIRKNWRDTRFHGLSDEQRENIMDGRRRTALERLAQRYKWFSIFAFAMIPIVPFMLYAKILQTPDFEIKFVWILFAMFYFGLCALMDRWLYNGIKGIDCSVMSVADVSEKAWFYRKRHLQFVMILLPMAILIVGSVVYFADGDRYLLYGIVAGAIAGLIAGSFQLMKFMSDYKSLRD